MLIVNEGTASALVDVRGGGVFNEGVGDFAGWFSAGENATIPQRQPDGRYVLAPLMKCLLLVREGHTLGDWAEAPARPVGVELVATPLDGNSVEDRWEIELRGPALVPVHGDAGHWAVVPHTPVVAEARRLERRYPDSA